ncbi:MAG: WbuC family cupin fold metalloprotein [Proteobacteria bacterium]|nr:WbuC family cupin fold metalloprotein [Pseudomonadota bacterium]MBU1389466.1 WbuC family cupin fold metalloprotein [Pseudomonadota bacterium]MBU1541286.1 WbuC family cupin fold metalloprotein [Pseudomonadota bacterium]
MKTENIKIPQLSEKEIIEHFQNASGSGRQRYPKILHEPGSEFNRVFNFMKKDSYMQPHLHPGEEKIEKMYLIKGAFAVLFFDNEGHIKRIVKLEKKKKTSIEIPAFEWHTYVMLSDEVITYETMMGKYNPETWKKLAIWAPAENTKESKDYLNWLKQMALE